jgi:hypothetical protein
VRLKLNGSGEIIRTKPMTYEQDFDQVVTFEAYYKDYVLNKDFLLLPYINIGISNHPIMTTIEIDLVILINMDS